MLFSRYILLILTILFGLAAAPVFYHYSQGNLSLAEALPPKEKTDAVMVFTGSADRLAQGYEYYLKGGAKKLMITGYDYPLEAREPKIRKLSKKVKRGKIYIDLKARNTIENAENGAQWAIKNKVNSILLITSEGHMPRAYFELRRLLPATVKIYIDAVPGTIKYPGLDSEQGRLLCRVYETATGTSFCYQTRNLARGLGL